MYKVVEIRVIEDGKVELGFGFIDLGEIAENCNLGILGKIRVRPNWGFRVYGRIWVFW